MQDARAAQDQQRRIAREAQPTFVDPRAEVGSATFRPMHKHGRGRSGIAAGHGRGVDDLDLADQLASLLPKAARRARREIKRQAA